MKPKLIAILFLALVFLPMVAHGYCDVECKIKRRWNRFLDKMQAPGVPLPPPPPAITFPFGGVILATFPCPCNAGIAVIILPIHGSAGPYFIPFFSLKEYFAAIPGNFILGGAVPGGVCLSPLICLPLPTAFTVTPLPGAGTSLLP